MLLRAYKGNQPVNLAIIILTGVILWTGALIIPPSGHNPVTFFRAPLHELIDRLIGHSEVLRVMVSMVLTVVLGLTVNWLNGKYYYIPERSFLPVLFVILLPGAFTEILEAYPVLFSAILLVCALDRLFKTYGQNQVSFSFFEAALIISVSSLFYYPSIIFILVVWIAASILRTFSWREWFTPLIGMLIPYAFLFGIHYLVHGNIEKPVENILNWIESGRDYGYSLPQLLWLMYLALLVLVASYHMISRFVSKKVSSRRYLQIIFWIFIFSMGSYFLAPWISIELLYIAAIPLSYLFTTYFLFARPRFWCELFFTFLFLGILAVRITDYIK